MAQNDRTMKGDVLSFASDMKKWVNNKDLSDIKFVIGPGRKVIYGHRLLLAARSEVFRAMFAETGPSQGGNTPSSRDVEVPFVLSDTSPEIFLAMMEFIYTNCVSLNSKITIDVMGMAIEYGLDGLRMLCTEYMRENLSVNTAAETMQAAVTFGQDELRDSALEYIERNTQNVFKSKSFHEMSEAALAVILQSDLLRIDEQDILTNVREWATVNSVVIGLKAREVASTVIGHVRLPLLSPEELKDVEEENAKDGLIPVDLIAFAWKCHALKAGVKDNALTTKRKGTVARDCHKNMQLS